MKPVRLAWWIFVAVIAALLSLPLWAAPLYEARVNQGAVLITIHSEPCALPVVVGLPKRATWVEGDKTYEGCVGLRPDFGLLVFYFTDRTIGLVPVNAFVKVTTS